MSIQLDWNVEAPDGEHQIGEDPAALEARRRRRRSLVRAAVLVGVILLAAGIAAWIRYRQVQDFRRAMLIATVKSEALALRIGDLQGFMKRQAGDGLWISHQTRLFQQYQTLTPRVQISGEIIVLRIDGDQAAVTVREVVDGDSVEGIWLYEYTDKGWRHVATPAEPWSPNRAFSRPGFEFSYNEQDDEILAIQVAATLGWMRAQTIKLTGYHDLPVLQVWIEPLGEALGWLDAEQTTLVIPVRSADGTRRTALDAAMQSEIAALLAQRWTEAMFVELGVPMYHRWIEPEMAAFLRHALDPAAPPAPMLDPLVTAFGPELMPTFIESMRDRPIPGAALPAAMRATAPQGLSDEALLEHLTYLLQAEVGLRGRLHNYGSADGRVLAVFTDLLINSSGNATADPPMWNSPIDPASLRAVAAEEVGGVLWAEVHYSIGDSTESGRTWSIVADVPFRNIDGQWLRTVMLTPQDWGGDQVAHGQHVVLRYPGMDAPLVEELLPELDWLYEQLAADFGLEELPVLTIEVMMWPPRYIYPTDVDVRVTSPHAMPCSAAHLTCIRDEASRRLVWWALGNARGWSSDANIIEYYPRTPIEQAIVDWELSRLSPPDGDASPPTGRSTSVPALETLWLNSWTGDGEYDWRAVYLGLSTLFDVLVDRYGIEAMHALIDNLDRAISMETWLRQSLDIGIADVEPQWQMRFEEALRENGYTLEAEQNDGR